MESEVPENISGDKSRSARRWLGAIVVVGGVIGFVVWSPLFDPVETFRTGLAAVKRGDWQKGQQCTDRLAMHEDYQAHANLLKAYKQRARGESEDAFVTFSKANAHPDTRELAYHEAASMLYEAGQYSQTILMCRQVLEWNPARTDSQRLLAAAYYDIGAMAQAIRTLQVVIEQQPTDHRPHYMQASILHDFERFEDAALAYEQAAKRVPQHSAVREEVLTGWGECLVRLRRYSAALKVMKPVASGPAVQAQRAVAFFALRQLDDALETAESSLQQRPLQPEAAAIAAQCYESNGDIERGVALLKRASDAHPHELELHLRLADMLGAVGQLNDALEHRKIAATILDSRREFSHKQQALVHNDNDAGLRLEIAQLAEQLGKIEIARCWLRASAGMDSATADIQLHWQQFQQRHPPSRGSSSVSERGF